MVVFVCITTAAQQQNKPLEFPSQRQIELLITQAERAFSTYEAAVQLEQAEFGAAAGAGKDHEVTLAAQQLLTRLKKDSGSFNSPFGFLLILNLDDASRNMAVCMGQASNAAMGLALDHKVSDATQKMTVGQTCLNTSQLLYTVSENATAMYEDYLLANTALQNQAVETLQKCSDAMKRCSKTP
jgi:hypothetical protein